MGYVPKLMCKEQHRREQPRKTVHAPRTQHASLLICAASVHAAAGSLSPGVVAGCLLLPCASGTAHAAWHMPFGT